MDETRRALLLPGAVLIAYAGTLHHAFQFDDYNVIVDNPAVHSLAAWRASMPGIRPLLKLSYAATWNGPDTLAFHLFNLCCHLTSTLLVYALCRRLLAPRLRNAEGAALITALLFALHPAQTEAVTYLCGRSVALMGLFYLGSLWSYFCGPGPWWRSAISPALFAAALLTRETAWTVPFALLLLEGARGTGWRDALRRLWPHWATLLAAAAALTAISGYRHMLLHSLSIRPTLDNVLLQIDGVYYLITYPLLALHTNIDPDLLPPALDAALLWHAAVLAALVALGFTQLRRRPWLGAGLLWFFLQLLPTNSLLPRMDAANDRQLYLAMLGPALILAVALQRWFTRKAAVAVTVALVLILGSATVLRNRDYTNEITLWRATTAASPHKARGWNNLGYALQLAGDREGAIGAYRQALELNPGHVQARINLSILEGHGGASRP